MLFKTFCKIGRIIEGTEMMDAMEPAFIDVRVALLAVVVHHQRCGRNKRAARGIKPARAHRAPLVARADAVLVS